MRHLRVVPIAIVLLFGFVNPPTFSSEPISYDVSIADFNRGFQAGYKAANPMGICPIPPIPQIGRDTYQDGFGLGYLQGLQDK